MSSVSLVITVYNRERYLGAAIASVLAQTHSEFELLVWDDGSTDRSLEIAQDYASRDRRVRVIAAAHQGRVSALRNAIAYTTGTYLGWVDSDDLLDPNALQETVAALNAHPNAGMVYTDYLDMDEAGKILGTGDRCQIPYSKERLLLDFMTFHFRLLRRSVFEQVGGIDGSLDYVEDYDLCLRLSEVTEIRRVRKPLYYYRHHESSASRQWRIEQMLRSRTVIRKALQRRGLSDQFEIEIQFPQGQFVLRRRQNVSFKQTLRSPLTPLKKGGTLLTSYFSNKETLLAPLSKGGWGDRISALTPLLIALSLATVPATLARAQSITPANDGTNTVVIPTLNRFTITGGTQAGENLFHSFQRFGLNQGQIANFLANPSVQNILGRVTGGDPSVINGLIQVTGSSANLYLMNPAGIVFGPSASLNVSGSFLATTASGVGFGCGVSGVGCGWFNAVGTSNYDALVGTPNAFAFATTQPGAVVNAGNLAVSEGKSITLVGGTVLNTGQLTAPGGEITLTAVPGEKLVRISQTGNPLSLEFSPLPPPSSPASPSPLPFTPPTLPQLLTGGNLESATGVTVNPNGTIQLSGSNLPISTEPGTAIASGTLTTSPSSTPHTPHPTPSITILGTQVGLISATLNASSPSNGGTVRIGGDYQGTGTVPNATSTFVDASTTINANSLQSGNGGQVVVWADQATRFYGTINARGGTASGNGGSVEVSGKQDLVYQGFVDVSAPAGNAGTLLLDPTNITIVAGANGSGTGDAALPDIFAADFPGDITVSEGALEGFGYGNIILEATNNITITAMDGGELNLFNADSVVFRADSDGDGAGNFTMVATDTISTFGTPITISGANLTVGDITTSGGGEGGAVTLSATGTITVGDIDSSAVNEVPGSNAGNVIITSTTGAVTTGLIDASSTSGQAGAVNISASGNITTDDIDTSNFSGFGSSAGNVQLSSTVGSITTGDITTAGDTQAGTVRLLAPGSNGVVRFSSINASGTGRTAARGNTVSITAGNFVQGFGQIGGAGTPTIDARGVGGFGTITIQHGGGLVNTPFVVGDSTVNGTTGNLITGTPTQPDEVAPIRSFSQNFSTTNISILTTFPPPPTPPTPLPTPETPPNPTADPEIVTDLADTPEDEPPLEVPQGDVPILDDPGDTEVARVEEDASVEFEEYLDLPDNLPALSAEASEGILERIGATTGVKPALIYVSFIPASVATQGQVGGGTGEKGAIAPFPSPPLQTASSQAKSLPASHAQRQKFSPSDQDQLELLVVTATGKPIRKLVAGATRGQVLTVTQQFIKEITDPRKVRTTSYLKTSQQLYRWLLAPVEPDLQARGISNLAYISDTGLRFIPMVALHDGKQFLVEKYSVGLMPSLSLTDTRYVSLKNAEVLAMGASQFADQPPLPAVPTELKVITTDLWRGSSFLNQDFTLANLKAQRAEEPYQIIHLATHGEFQPGALSNSYIQLWDGKLQLDQLRQLGWSNPPVELLVLSACRTALGNDDAELGFAGFAVQAGVKTALASLWSVSDEGTLALMAEFYRQLKTAPIKAEALRQAQIAMLRGQVQIDGTQIRTSRGGDLVLPATLVVGGKRSLNHPYYWASFTLIGSPW